MDNVTWKLNESNKISFNMEIESSDVVDGTPKVRLVCEGNGMNYVFLGKFEEDGVEFKVPSMKGKLDEGISYPVTMELIIGDHYFTPYKFEATFDVGTKVFVEMKKPEVDKKKKMFEVSMKKTEETKPKQKRQKVKIKPQIQESKTKIKSLKEKFGK